MLMTYFLPVLTFGNCVLKTGVIKWPVKLYVRYFLCFLRFFFKIQKNTTTFLSCCTRFLDKRPCRAIYPAHCANSGKVCSCGVRCWNRQPDRRTDIVCVAIIRDTSFSLFYHAFAPWPHDVITSYRTNWRWKTPVWTTSFEYVFGTKRPNSLCM